MAKRHNHPAPPLGMAKTYGHQWVGVVQTTLRLATIAANLKQGRFGHERSEAN